MSRTRLLRRLERFLAQVEALEGLIDTRGLEELSEEQLRLWEILLEEELLPRSLVEQEALFGRILNEPEFVAAFLAEHEPPADTARPEPTVPSLDREEPGAAEEPPKAVAVQERPEESAPPVTPKRLRRSTDLPDPSPLRGEWWRVTFRPYRPPGWRPRAAQERPFFED